MPTNANAEAAWNYHEVTKHSYTSVRTNPHFLDFGNQPLPFKIYPALEPSRMPTEVRQTGVAALSAIAGSVPCPDKRGAGLRGRCPTPIPFRRHYPAEKISGRRNLFSRGRVHGSALRSRALSGLPRTRRTFRLASITSPLPSSACAGCAPETIAVSWSRPPAANPPSLTRR